MAQRDDLFQQFGPILLEAMVIATVTQLNELRTKLRMPLITKQDVFDELNNHLSELTTYEWMDELNVL